LTYNKAAIDNQRNIIYLVTTVIINGGQG